MPPISLLLPFPQMVYKTVTGRELFQQQSKFSVMNLVDLAQKNQKVVDNKSEKEYNTLKKTSLSTGKTAGEQEQNAGYTDAGDGFMNIPDGVDEQLPFA